MLVGVATNRITCVSRNAVLLLAGLLVIAALSDWWNFWYFVVHLISTLCWSLDILIHGCCTMLQGSIASHLSQNRNFHFSSQCLHQPVFSFSAYSRITLHMRPVLNLFPAVLFIYSVAWFTQHVHMPTLMWMIIWSSISLHCWLEWLHHCMPSDFEFLQVQKWLASSDQFCL